MSFSVSFRAESKSDALQKIESADMLPKSVKEFVQQAIHSIDEVVEGEWPDVRHTPTPINVSATGHLGGDSTCSISVSVAK